MFHETFAQHFLLLGREMKHYPEPSQCLPLILRILMADERETLKHCSYLIFIGSEIILCCFVHARTRENEK